MKRWLALILMALMCIGFSMSACADDGVDYEDNNDYSHELEGLDGTPSLSRWTYTSSTTQAISINSSGTATVTASVTGYYDKAVKVVMYMYLQRSTDSGWTNLASYQHTFNSYHGAAEHYYSTCAKGYNYRLRCSYYVYAEDGTCEHIIAYSGTKAY